MWRNKLCHTSPNTWDLYSGNQLVKIPLEVSCLPCPGWIGGCVFGKMLFLALGHTPNVPYESRNPTEKMLDFGGQWYGTQPCSWRKRSCSVITSGALWKKRGFHVVAILRQLNPSAKLFFACGQATVDRLRHEDLLLATRVPPRTSQAQRTHQMAHMMWPNSWSVKMADPLNLESPWIPWNLGESG